MNITEKILITYALLYGFIIVAGFAEIEYCEIDRKIRYKTLWTLTVIFIGHIIYT